MRQSLRLFAPSKTMITEKKLQAMHDKNEKAYSKLAHELRLEWQKCLLTITKKACDEANVPP